VLFYITFQTNFAETAHLVGLNRFYIYRDYLGGCEIIYVKRKGNKNTKTRVLALFIFVYSRAANATLQTKGDIGKYKFSLLVILLMRLG
jgi:hypothetical protein